MLKRLFAFIALTLFLAGCATAQQPSLVGDWSGTLNVAGGSLGLIFHITESDDGYSTTIESVDQGNVMIPTEIEVDGDSVRFTVDQLGIEYIATISGDQIIGVFAQQGFSVPNYTITRTD